MKALLRTAELTVSDDEFKIFSASYPALRAAADGLYLPHLESEEPAITYDPTVDYKA
jgi:hypothetical protein